MKTRYGFEIPPKVYQALVDWLGQVKADDVVATQLGYDAIGDYFYIPNYCGMYVGIEKDGHIHS